MTIGSAFFAGGGGVGAGWNPSDKGANIAISGVLNSIATKSTVDNNQLVRATLGRDGATDQGYFEVYILGGDTSPFMTVGLAPLSTSVNSFPGADANSYSYYEQTGQKYNNNSPTAFGAAYLAGDVIGVALNAGKVWFSKNGVWQASGNPAAGTNPAFSGITGTLYPCISLYRGSSGPSQAALRIAATFQSYSPPSGFAAWDR